MTDTGTQQGRQPTRPGTPGPDLTACVRAATSAPSLHNSQPWRFRVGADSVEVYADPRRRLEVLDPAGRELLISVGAAVFTLRLAVRGAGHLSDLTLFPDPAQPDLVARVDVRRPMTPSPAAEALVAAIAHRHTNRWPFARCVVPADVTEHLVDAARREGATLTVANPVSRDAILNLSQQADRALRAQGRYRAELARWTSPYAGRSDGVPGTAVGPWDALEILPIRDFGLLQPRVDRPTARFEPYPSIMVLATDGDTRRHWVNAGQALQRVLLTATWLNLATTPISQPVEIPAVRRLLTDTATGGWRSWCCGWATAARRPPRHGVPWPRCFFATTAVRGVSPQVPPRRDLRPCHRPPHGPNVIGEQIEEGSVMRNANVDDVMTTAVVSVGPGASYRDLVDLLVANRFSAVPVVDAFQRVTGLVSEADLLRKIEYAVDDEPRLFEGRRRRGERAKAHARTAGDLMSAPAVTVLSGTSIAAAARLMADEGVKRLPVVDDLGRLIGIVSRADLLKVHLRPDDEILADIETGVLRTFLADESAAVTVAVVGGVVTLAGKVDRRSAADLLVRLVRTVNGVVAVDDDLTAEFDDRDLPGTGIAFGAA